MNQRKNFIKISIFAFIFSASFGLVSHAEAHWLIMGGNCNNRSPAGSRGSRVELVKSPAECQERGNMWVRAQSDKTDQTRTCAEAPNEGMMDAFFNVDTFTCTSVR